MFLAGVIGGAPIVCLIGASYVTELTGGGQLARAAVAAGLLLTVIGLAAAGLRASATAQLVLVSLLTVVVVVAAAGSATAAARMMLLLRSNPGHGVSSGRKTSSRSRGTSRHRVGRLSYMVMANRFTQNAYCSHLAGQQFGHVFLG